MKAIILILFTVIFATSFNLKSQEKSQLDSMINVSMFRFIDNRKDLCSKGVLPEKYFENLYLSLDNYPRNFSFCKEFQDMKLKSISLTNLTCQKILKRGKIYNIIFLDIKLHNNIIIITYSDRNVSIHRKNNIQIEISGWGIYTYQYSCENQNWNLIQAKYGGI